MAGATCAILQTLLRVGMRRGTKASIQKTPWLGKPTPIDDLSTPHEAAGCVSTVTLIPQGRSSKLEHSHMNTRPRPPRLKPSFGQLGELPRTKDDMVAWWKTNTSSCSLASFLPPAISSSVVFAVRQPRSF